MFALPRRHAPELSAFGWWFISETFDEAWGIAHLKKALEFAGQIDPADLVLEHLAAVSDASPVYAVECLRLIVEGEPDNFLIRGSLSEVRTLLRRALHSQVPAAHQLARNVVNELGARGYWELGELLTEVSADP